MDLLAVGELCASTLGVIDAPPDNLATYRDRDLWDSWARWVGWATRVADNVSRPVSLTALSGPPEEVAQPWDGLISEEDVQHHFGALPPGTDARAALAEAVRRAGAALYLEEWRYQAVAWKNRPGLPSNDVRDVGRQLARVPAALDALEAGIRHLPERVFDPLLNLADSSPRSRTATRPIRFR